MISLIRPDDLLVSTVVIRIADLGEHRAEGIEHRVEKNTLFSYVFLLLTTDNGPLTTDSSRRFSASPRRPAVPSS